MAVKITELSSVAIEGSDWVGEARRQVIRLAYSIGFPKEIISRIELVVTEMATNLIQHRTVSPILRFGATHILEESGITGNPSGLLIISEDRGPGIANMERALQDRYSTAGTMGGGLGAIQRHSEEFSLASDIVRSRTSHPGTVVASRFWLAPPSSDGTLDCEILTRPKPGETQNGDGASFSRIGERYQLAIIDGLGHGIDAFKSTRQIQEVFRAHPSLRMQDLMERGHRAMHGGRGAVVGILQMDQLEGQTRYVGVGNIDCRIYGKNPSRPISMNGSLGVVLPRCREESYPFGPDDFFVMASDGISTRWEPESYPQFLRAPHVMKGALLFRDYSRLTDDATLAVGSFKKR